MKLKSLFEKCFYWPKKATSFDKSDMWACHFAALTSLLLLIPIAQDMTSTKQEKEEKFKRLEQIHPLMPYNPVDNSTSRLIVIIAANLTLMYKNRQVRLYKEYLQKQNQRSE